MTSDEQQWIDGLSLVEDPQDLKVGRSFHLPPPQRKAKPWSFWRWLASFFR